MIALGPDQCDPAQPARLPDIIRGLNPDVIVNAAGYTAVDQAEQEEELDFTVNAESVGVLEEEARRTGAILVHYSTDYVFDGKKSAPYAKRIRPAPSTSMVVASLRAKPPFVNRPMRTSSSAPPGFMPLAAITSCEPFSDWCMSAGGLQIVADQVGAPTWARDIADATSVIIQAIVRERAAGRFGPGLFNLTASGAATRHAIAQVILRNGKVQQSLLR